MNIISKIALISALPALAVGCKESESKKGVNFVIINLDDAGNGDFSHRGALGYHTPTIDSVARSGINCTNFYAVQAISGASRAGLITGCYPNRIGFAYALNPNSPTGIADNEMTIGELVKQRDYATAIFGKWHLGDSKQFLPLQHGFDHYYGLPYSNDMWPNHPQYKFPDLPLIEGNEILGYNTDQSVLTTEYTERSVKFINDNKDRPFLLYLAHSMPHVPLAVSDKFKGKSDQGMYGDVMMELDWSVEQIYSALRKNGLEDNTVVIITSDNGPWANYGDHAGSSGGLREAKATTFNGGLRVPCLITYGKNIEPRTYNGLMSNIDIFATIADIADLPLPEHKIDGVSFKEQIVDGDDSSPRESLALYYHKNSLEAITDGVFKLIFPHKYTTYEKNLAGNGGAPGDLQTDEVVERELYDLRRDPAERVNVYDQYPAVVERLSTEAQRYRYELGDDLTDHQGSARREPGRLK